MLHYKLYRSNNLDSPWITFIHGAGGSSSIWFKQIRFFSRFFNLLLIDLRGHGNSKSLILNPFQPKYTFNAVTDDIIEVLNKEKILKSHFVGISLGTILIRKIAEINPERIITMVMAGAIIKLNFTKLIIN